MGILKNRLSWSFSRDRLFRHCRRAYYYNYYASWGWWKDTADEFTKRVNILKKIKNLAMWRGEIVHEVIKWILEERRRGRKISKEIAHMKARSLLKQGWRESKNKEWAKDTKKLNLFEHYYNMPISKKRIQAVKHKVYGCINNFYNSDFLKRLDRISLHNFLHIEDIESFKYRGLKIYVNPDFALKTDKYYLFDWKTGNLSSEVTLQLSCYKLFGMKKWNIPIENIKIIPVYLNKNNITFTPLTNLNIEGVKKYIERSIKKMKSLLSDVKSNKANIDNFPMTDKKNKCRECFFQELCK